MRSAPRSAACLKGIRSLLPHSFRPLDAGGDIAARCPYLRLDYIAKHPAEQFNQGVQFEFNLRPPGRLEIGETLALSARQVPLILIRNRRARRYILRLDRKGAARVTIPRWGSAAEARRFAARNKEWLERQFRRLEALPKRPGEWRAAKFFFAASG